MKPHLLFGAASLCICLCSAPVRATGVLFHDPVDGWLYTYEGAGTAFGSGAGVADSLDGSWVRGGNSDAWDGSGLGGVFGAGNQPGGVESQAGGGVDFLRIQDTGDPRNQSGALGYEALDPSNRKIYLVRPLDLPGDVLETGVTLAFRIRIATTGVLDPQFPNTGSSGENQTLPGGTAWVPNGNLNADDAKGFIVLHGAISGTVGFSPALPADQYGGGRGLFTNTALVMNNLNGTTASRDVDIWNGEPGTTNILPVIDWSQWHEFWVTVKADTSGSGTHHVEMFVDGAFAPVSFELTAGTGTEGGATAAMNYVGMGFSNSPQMGAVDLDYMAVKAGIFAPVPEPGGGVLLMWAAWLAARRSSRRKEAHFTRVEKEQSLLTSAATDAPPTPRAAPRA